jgi:hypothetical protein
MGLCKRAKTLCYSGRLAPSPDAGSLPLLLMIMKLVCVCADHKAKKTSILGGDIGVNFRQAHKVVFDRKPQDFPP